MIADPIPISQYNQISDHLDCLGENVIRREEDKPALRKISGRVGDFTYHMLLDQLGERVNNRHFHEKRINEYFSNLIAQRKGGNGKDYFKDTKSILPTIKEVGSLTYLEEIFGGTPPCTRRRQAFRGVPFSLFDSHFHSYAHIRKYLLNSKEPVNIIRADAHGDYWEKEKIDGSSYVYHLLKDPAIQSKIRKLIDLSGEKSFQKVSGEVNNVQYIASSIKDLPIIKGPSIIDVDLDVHEKSSETGRWGGTWYKRFSNTSAEYYNQQEIIVHPKFVARTLKNKIEDPRLILIATERAWRNRFFFWTIERDFLEELAA